MAKPTEPGECWLNRQLRENYPDFLLINNIMISSGSGTTQIDHILISPKVSFVIETKDINAEVFGHPNRKDWLMLYKLRNGLKKFDLYNPLMQNEGHAQALLKLGAVTCCNVRPVVVFVGDATLRTADKFLSFAEHESQACEDRIKGTLCMGFAALRDYIEVAIEMCKGVPLTLEEMQGIHNRILQHEIPLTKKTQVQHNQRVEHIKEKYE